MRVLGMISGTSHDGIDTAVVGFRAEGTHLRGRLEHTGSVPYSPALRQALVAALPPNPSSAAALCELDTRVGQEFAAAAAAALAALPAGTAVDAVCSHGQTVHHWVRGGRALGTLQVGQPAWIAEATGLAVVSDLRAADVAAGGQGAPLVPLLDRLLLAPLTAAGRRAGALNLGGIANVTVCAPGSAPLAWDTGPANALIDAVVAADPSVPDGFDRDGRLAAAGAVDEALLAELLTEPYYARPAPKSTGKELFHAGHVAAALRRTGRSPDLPDLVATLTELTARTVAAAVRPAHLERLFASGGGVRNPALLTALARRLPGVEVLPSEELGCPADAKEAVAFALLGWAALHGLPGSEPSCTGARGARVLGRVTPAPGGGVPRPGPVAAPVELVLDPAAG
ncbi:anhydro-N-acetylmuramic acid kinase [Kineococcus indalonis]|uniref:anhydro-N-acetylmuramic acid kinase n=1 Tax=Kineococcus indalonis TaxID=2696566 RepID=UPI0014133724|nr:anhydro-N-acetylmuramic acid kinase [Kineococcus indalonis]NAZ87905.1 anhydro-N-acetylmuramic acid kinase [Kineococcus indalonis]NAZ87906.1 anhydro-N-acetylmuramic acid kinase [Kineococcus indalonis]